MIKNKVCLITFQLLFSITVLFSQDTIALRYGNYISAEIIKKHLSVLASDSLEGRETAMPGMIKAAAYVSQQFAAFGIPPCNKGSYFQQIPLMKQLPENMKLTIGGKVLNYGSDYFTIDAPPSIQLAANEIVFVGYGITDSLSGWDDYKDKDVSGKVVLILDGEPVNKKGIALVSGKKEASKWQNDRMTKVELATNQKAAAILLIHQDYEKTFEKMNKRLAAGRLMLDNDEAAKSTPIIYVSKEIGNRILLQGGTDLASWEKKQVRKRKSMGLSIAQKVEIVNNARKVSCNNVLGFIEGSSFKEEIIVITAHLDHLGKRDDKIYYGADDDGSGSASILNIAEAFEKAKNEGHGPKRSILVMTFSGEEKGLLGSEYYTNFPVFPLKNTVANLNIDMIGRVDTIARNSVNYTYLIGSDKLSTQLHSINENANRNCCNLELDYRYNDPSDKLKLYYRSDHYNFAKNNIPVIFYFTGLHEDYHKPTDTIDKIDFDKTAKIAQLVFATAWELANRKERISVDVESDFK